MLDKSTLVVYRPLPFGMLLEVTPPMSLSYGDPRFAPNDYSATVWKFRVIWHDGTREAQVTTEFMDADFIGGSSNQYDHIVNSLVMKLVGESIHGQGAAAVEEVRRRVLSLKATA